MFLTNLNVKNSRSEAGKMMLRTILASSVSPGKPITTIRKRSMTRHSQLKNGL
jgi:hypothetical protein